MTLYNIIVIIILIIGRERKIFLLKPTHSQVNILLAKIQKSVMFCKNIFFCLDNFYDSSKDI